MKQKKMNPLVRYLKNYSGILVALFVICLALALTTETFLTPKNLINILRQISINALIAFGMTMLIIVGGIDLSVGGVCAMSGCCVVVLINAGVPIFAAVLLALLLGAVCGLLNGLLVTKVGIMPFVVTLSTCGVFKGLGYMISGGKSVACKVEAFSYLGTGYVGVIPVPVIIMLIVMFICYIIMNKTVFGQQIYAAGGNDQASRYSGINTNRVRRICYVISAVLASLAGVILASKMYSGQPSVGTGYEGDAIAASVLGGVSMLGGFGSIGGTMIGSIVIGVISNGMNLLGFDYPWQLIIEGGIVLLAVAIDTAKKQKFFEKCFASLRKHKA